MYFEFFKIFVQNWALLFNNMNILNANFDSEEEDEDFVPTETKTKAEEEVKPVEKSEKVSKIWEMMKSSNP